MGLRSRILSQSRTGALERPSGEARGPSLVAGGDGVLEDVEVLERPGRAQALAIGEVGLIGAPEHVIGAYGLTGDDPARDAAEDGPEGLLDRVRLLLRLSQNGLLEVSLIAVEGRVGIGQKPKRSNQQHQECDRLHVSFHRGVSTDASLPFTGRG